MTLDEAIRQAIDHDGTGPLHSLEEAVQMATYQTTQRNMINSTYEIIWLRIYDCILDSTGESIQVPTVTSIRQGFYDVG